MEKNLKKLFSMDVNPVFGIRSGVIVFANPAAVRVVGEGMEGKLASDYLPESILTNDSDEFVATCFLAGKRACASVATIEAIRVISFTLEDLPDFVPIAPFALVNELRSRISGIRMAAEQIFLKMDLEQDPKLSAYSSMFYHNYYGILRMIGSVDTAISFMNASEELCPSVTDVDLLCAELVDSVSHFLSPDGVKICYKGAGEPIFAAVDREKLEQLLLNLLSNSLMNTKGTINVGLKKQSDKLILSVDDDGRGISPEVMATVFSRFNRKLSLTELAGGAGFGLYISKSIAELHGGTLIIESREGSGTCVRAMLPADLQPSARFRATRSAYGPEGMHNILTELSGILPAENYSRKYLD